MHTDSPPTNTRPADFTALKSDKTQIRASRYLQLNAYWQFARFGNKFLFHSFLYLYIIPDKINGLRLINLWSKKYVKRYLITNLCALHIMFKPLDNKI